MSRCHCDHLLTSGVRIRQQRNELLTRKRTEYTLSILEFETRLLAARGESPASHRGRRCARLARRDEREYREDLKEEQRRQRECSVGRMMLEGARGRHGADD